MIYAQNTHVQNWHRYYLRFKGDKAGCFTE